MSVLIQIYLLNNHLRIMLSITYVNFPLWVVMKVGLVGPSRIRNYIWYLKIISLVKFDSFYLQEPKATFFQQ